MKSLIAVLLAAILATPAHVAADAPAKVLVFDLEIVDTSGEGTHPDHAGRLERMTAVLRDGLGRSGRYDVTAVRDSAVAAELPASVVRTCNGCELDLGRKAGADIVVTGFIHKISTLVLSLKIIMRDVGSGETVAIGIADIRGDNERAWRHGVEWLLRHRLATGTP
ncbi:MAG TPA: DUF3280 domain-containing protein [Azospirillum sp.]|nr:DUF3280 domain-containing protein [Azospirillum sp.]